jgi:hypothetical protein
METQSIHMLAGIAAVLCFAAAVYQSRNSE